MSSGPISVVVVSRHRAEALKLCLLSLTWQDVPKLEIVVVADPAALAQLGCFGDRLRLVPFDEPNISVARNMGLAAAAGEIVAFIDDDAIAEPTWARRLTSAFNDPDVVAATGFVRGRNGMTLQWAANEVDTMGQDHPIPVHGDQGFAHDPVPGRAVKAVGTNCAFRAAALRQIGGFDPAFHFYLEDADVSLRLATHGKTAVVPLAMVQHGFAASARRRADRAPLTLNTIAASTAVFLRRHAPQDLARGLQVARSQQRKRLLSLLVDGRLEPRDVGRLLASFDQGQSDGLARTLLPLRQIEKPKIPYLDAGPAGPRPGLVLMGRPWQHRSLDIKAAAAAAQGHVVTLICLSPTVRPLWQRFRSDGVWEIRGGIWGKADRRTKALAMAGFSARVTAIVGEFARFRPIRTPDSTINLL